MRDTQDDANRMVQEILAQYPDLSTKVINALMGVPRGAFLGNAPSVDINLAYEDRSLPISGSTGHVASLSQPSLVASMLEALEVRQGQRVLEIGTGSGYAAALLSELTGQDACVTTLEVDSVLAEKARKNLRDLGKAAVKVLEADAFVRPSGLANGEFDRVLFSTSVQVPPEWIVRSLTDGGTMVFPLDLLITRPGWPCLLARLQKEADALQGNFLMGLVQGWEPLKAAVTSPDAHPHRQVEWDANGTWHLLESLQGGLTGRMAPTGLLACLLGRIEVAFQSGQIQSLEDCRSWLASSGWRETHREWLRKGSPGVESFVLSLTHSLSESCQDKELVWMRSSDEKAMCLLV